jgi:lipopolysaccharide/colanic/teichoic acid biosynthesis glycosyltransferase
MTTQELHLEVQAMPEPHLGYDAMKRLLDILLVLAAAIVVVPLGLVVGLLIVITSGWPVFFAQARMGLGGKQFRCLKFRTMVKDAESRRDEVLHLNTTGGPAFKVKSDPRLTTVGKVLRMLSLDELPQLWNVLIGEMSLVGPRPLPIVENVYEGDQALRLSVKPGITCSWQVSGRSGITFDQWMEMDLEYVRRRSIGGDIKLLLRTIPAVLSRRGAM